MLGCLSRLRRDRRRIRGRDPGSHVSLRASVRVTKLDQGREEQQDLRKDRHACKRVTNRSAQTAPLTDTHGS